jgi:hypothetical protein
MLRAKYLLVLLATLVTVPAQAGLIGFYTFEGNANDVSGSGNHGTVVGATLTASGYEGQAYDFSGSGQYIQSPININPTGIGSLPALTMGAWVQADAVGLRSLISHDNGGFDRSLYIDTRGAACPGASSCFSAFTGAGVLAGSTITPSPTVWHFVAARYNAATTSLTLDVDGVRVSTSSANPGTGWTFTRIGANPSFAEYFDGRMDNVFFYDEALTDARLDEIRIGGASEILGISAVPEPGSLALLAAAMLGCAFVTRRRAG